MNVLPEDLFHKIVAIDTPTLCNALEKLVDRAFTTGYTGSNLRCLTKPRSVGGYAATVTLTTRKPPAGREPISMAEYLDHLDTVPSPRIAILYDEDDVPCGAAAFGDVMANYHKAMGCVAMVTNGVVRDLVGIEAAGMACYAQGLIASHGYFHFLRTGEPVNIHGLTIHQNDFLVGDEHGLVQIPLEVADRIPSEVERIRRREERLITYCQSGGFTKAGFVALASQEAEHH